MKYSKMTTDAAIALSGVCRAGSVITRQQTFLDEYVSLFLFFVLIISIFLHQFTSIYLSIYICLLLITFLTTQVLRYVILHSRLYAGAELMLVL